jgi:hypothetical protein
VLWVQYRVLNQRHQALKGGADLCAPSSTASALAWCACLAALSKSGIALSLSIPVGSRAEAQRTAREPGAVVQAMQKLRSVTLGASGRKSVTRPFRDARRSPST